MRAFRTVLLILGLLIGQSGFGRLSFVRSTGELCWTCPTLDDAVLPALESLPSDSNGLQSAPVHGDCHDCCTLVAKAPQPDDARLAQDISLGDSAAILPLAVTVSLLALRIDRDRVPIDLDAHPPTGPPSLHASRAPPASPIGI